MMVVSFTAHRPHPPQDKLDRGTNNERITKHELMSRKRAMQE